MILMPGWDSFFPDILEKMTRNWTTHPAPVPVALSLWTTTPGGLRCAAPRAVLTDYYSCGAGNHLDWAPPPRDLTWRPALPAYAQTDPRVDPDLSRGIGGHLCSATMG